MSAASPPQLPRRKVALLVESSRAYGRGVLHGIASYLRANGSWAIHYHECKLGELPGWLADWHGDGIIARIETPAMARAILRKGLPTVNTRGLLTRLRVPLVATDNGAVGRMAAEHLLARGFTHFAVCGFPGLQLTRVRTFQARLREAGFSCATYAPPPGRRRAGRKGASLLLSHEERAASCEADLEQWLAQLPCPIGILAWDDVRGLQVLNACRALGRAVPEQVAVLGVDNDELLCELADPPLSSVQLNTLGVGRAAATLLDRLMQGEAPPTAPLLLPPVGIVTRQSTDLLAVEDPHLAKALRFIHANACQGVDVDAVARATGWARRKLERHFVRRLRTTAKQEILRVQIERARALLATTSLPLAEIAERCGFKHPEHFMAVFKKRTGQRPGAFRTATQGARSGSAAPTQSPFASSV